MSHRRLTGLFITNLRISLTLLMLVGWLQTPALAKDDTPSSRQINNLIERSGMELQIRQIPVALRQAGAQQNSGPASLFVQPLMQTLVGIFKPDEMLSLLQKDLIKRLDVPTLLDAMQWYNSDNGQDIVAAQKKITEPEMLEKVGQALVSQKMSASPQRQQLLRDLAQATRATEAALNMMVNMQAAFMTGLTNMLAPKRPASFDDMHQRFHSSRGSMEQQLSQQLLIQQATVMADVPDATLREFLDFARTPSGQKLFKAVNESLDVTMRTMAEKIPAQLQLQ